jgi:hypothetical protein
VPRELLVSRTRSRLPTRAGPQFTNATAQSVQGFRFFRYWYGGGREADIGSGKVGKAVTDATREVKAAAKSAAA